MARDGGARDGDGGGRAAVCAARNVASADVGRVSDRPVVYIGGVTSCRRGATSTRARHTPPPTTTTHWTTHWTTHSTRVSRRSDAHGTSIATARASATRRAVRSRPKMVLANHERWRCECARRAWLRRAMACAMVVLLCAVHGVGAADVSDADAVEARGTGAVDGGRSTRARRGVDAALDALQTQRSTVLEFIDDVATCEQTFFIVDVSRGARVTVTAQDGRDMGKTWTFHESGSKHASCLEPGETQNLGITTEPGDDEGKSVSFRVENQHGDVLMMRDEDLKARAQTRYSSMTLPAKSKRVSKLGKKLGPCVDVVVGTAFSSNAGAKRQINHAIFTSDGTLVSEWTKHASGEKRMCLLEGRSYSLRVNGAATYGTVDDRLAVRVTRADGDPKDGYAYLLVRSEALFDEANHVYAAAQDETRDNMKLNGDFEFHIPKTCDIDEAELSVVVQTSTHGDGVPPHGMGWTMHDTDDKQVLTMTTPFKPSEYGVARMHSACVKNGMYKFNAIASDERGWNYGPKLGIYRRWNGEDRQLLVTLGADETVMKRVVSRPWFDQSLVSETVPVNIDRSSEQPSALGVDMQVPHGRKAIAVAALGDAQDATRRSAIGFNTASLVFACIAVYAFVAMYEGVGTIDVESKRSLVGEESVSAYGAGRAGVLDEEVASTSSPSRRKRASFEDVKFRAIAIGSSMLAIATSRHAMHVSTASLGQSQTYVKGAMCGMGVTNCKKLYAPDCQSRYMFTYRQGKLAHRPKHMLPYQSQVEKIPGKTVKVDVKFDPETCAVKAETCKDLGEFKGSVASLSKCFDKCRETENCKTFSVKSRSCHLCSSADIEPCESGECDAVASRANCMNKFKFSFVGASPEACAKVCEETMQCHAFNYFNRTATDPSHCALLRLPLGYEAHVWRESAKTSAGIDGAATYYKAPSDRQCEARDEQVAALALPEGLIEEKRRVDAALAEMNGADPLGYPDEDGYPYDDDSTSPWESTVPPSQEPESTTPESTTPESTVPSYPHDDDSTLPWESTTPESTTPESTVPSQGPESTTPESTTPESTVPSYPHDDDSTLPWESTTPESTTPESTVPSQGPESTTPESTTPESTVPSYPHDDDSTLPWESTTPESTTPESTVPSQGPESTTPESTTPESTVPSYPHDDDSTLPWESTTPESTTPESTVPSQGPESTTPESTTPESTVPSYPHDDDSTLPWESTTPESTTPESTVPSQGPESTTPESTTPESTVPSYPHDDDSTLPWESTTPESTTPESTVPSQGPESTTPESTTPESPTPESTIPSTYPSTVPESTTPPKREWHVTDKMVVTGYVVNTFGFQQSNAFTESMAQLFNIPDSTVAVVKLEAPAVEDNIIDVLVHFDITAEDESQANDISQTLKSMTDAKFTKNTQLVDIMNLMGCTKTSTVYVGDVPLVEDREEAVETIPTNATAWTREVFTQVEVKSDYTVETFDAQAQASFRQVMGQLLHLSPTDIRFTTIETVSASHRRLLATSSTLSFYVTVRVSTDAQAQEVIDVLNGWNDALAVDLQNAGLPVETTQTVLDPVVQVYSPSSDSAYPSSDAPSDSTSGDSSAPSVAPAPTSVPSSTSPGADADAAKTYNINVNVDVVINTNGVPFYDGCTGADCADAQDSTAPVEPASSSSSSSSSSPFYPTSTSSSTPPSPVDESSSDCVNPGSKTNFNLYDELGSLENTALQAAQAFAAENGLKVPDADAWVRPKICNLPHMKCCANLPDWRRDNQIRFPFVCGSAPVGCHTHTYDESKAKCVAEGGYLCRGNAVSTSMKDPTCPGTKTDFAWTLTRCDVNGVEGRVIRPSAGGAPGAMCETNLKARHQTRCCSNVC